MEVELMIKFAEYLVDRLKFRLTYSESGRYTYYNKQKDMEFIIDGECVYLYIFGKHRLETIKYNLSAICHLAEKLGYDH
jgi:hypothetical protein